MTVACGERARIYANRVQFSRSYTALYSAALILSLLLLLWVAVEEPLDGNVKFCVFVLADSAVTLFVVLEIVLRLIAVGKRRFCYSMSNILDVGVALLCLVTIFLHILGPTSQLELEDEVEAAVLCVRYSAQILRLVLLARHFRRVQRTQRAELEVHMDTDVACGEVHGHDAEAPGSATALAHVKA